MFFCSIAHAYPTLKMMLSPQGFSFSDNSTSEEENHLVPTAINNPKDVMQILKKFSFLGVLQSKINFLYSCIKLSLVPKGFKLKWSEQTGFSLPGLPQSVIAILNQTSVNLQQLIFSTSVEVFRQNLGELMSFKQRIHHNEWSKGMKSYQFLFLKSSEKHLKKLKLLSPEANLIPFFPSPNLFTSPEDSLPSITQVQPSSQNNPEMPTPPDDALLSEFHQSVETVSHTITPTDVSLQELTNYDDQSSLQTLVAVPDAVISQSLETQNLESSVETTAGPSTIGRPKEFNTMVFTPDLITPVYYDASNFKPICIDNVVVPEELIELASFSPSFCPTPTNLQPPDGNILHEDLLEYKKSLSWQSKFRANDFKACSSIEEFQSLQPSQFNKPPWYEKSLATPPALQKPLGDAFSKIYSTMMDPSNWYKYKQNIPPHLHKAVSLAKNLPNSGIGTYIQDKSSRICFASLSRTNEKVEQVLSDSSKYKRLSCDMATRYQRRIKSWYDKFKPALKAIPEDISKFLLPSNVSTPHLKVLIKTHKPDCPVRLTFSSIGSATSGLSTTLDHAYLKPILSSGLCNRRLEDTRQTLDFIEGVNDFLWKNDVTVRPTIFSFDVKNFFPSVPQSLAIPAVSKFLKTLKYSAEEIKAVTEGLKVVRNGNFFKWKETYFNQISGCALGDPDSCSYSDIAMAHLLNELIPACEQALSIELDPFFKVYRDDGMGFLFVDPTVLQNILDFFNSFNPHIQWTTPICSLCSMPEASCSHYDHLEFLDCLVT